MSILSGFKKVRRRIKLPDGYKLLSFWTSSQTVEMDDGTTLESNKTKWDDKYTKTEIDNKLSAIETNIDWKESVDTFSNITTTYPSPQDGWTVNVKDTDYTYRYNGSEWITISANAVPKATNNVDGLLTKEDHVKYEDAFIKKHEHSNKEVLDSITSEKVSKWNTIAESNVTGVKGNAESSYRTGNVNLTPASIGALPTTGGTLTGNISFNMNSSVQTPLKVYGGDQYGQGISLGAGGATIVGGGESAKSCENLLSATTEQLWLTSDNSIYFYTNCNTIGNKVGAVLDNSRQFYPNVNNTGSLGTSTYRWANLYTNSLNGTTLNTNGLASASLPGLTKLYTSCGSATDGTMTQKAITDALDNMHTAKSTSPSTLSFVTGGNPPVSSGTLRFHGTNITNGDVFYFTVSNWDNITWKSPLITFKSDYSAMCIFETPTFAESSVYLRFRVTCSSPYITIDWRYHANGSGSQVTHVVTPIFYKRS